MGGLFAKSPPTHLSAQTEVYKTFPLQTERENESVPLKSSLFFSLLIVVFFADAKSDISLRKVILRGCASQ